MAKTSDQQVAYFLHKLQRFRNYVAFSEKSWEQHLNEYGRSLRDDSLNLAEFGGKRDHWADLAQVFPQYHRRASFLMLFAMFEDDLNELCARILAEWRLPVSIKTCRGQGVQRAKKWLEDIASVDLASSAAAWMKIKQFGDVRNVLVHAAGFLERGNRQHNRVRKLAEKKTFGLELHHHARTELSLRPEFLIVVIDTLETFYKSLMSAIR
jgi:hypothetical protein